MADWNSGGDDGWVSTNNGGADVFTAGDGFGNSTDFNNAADFNGEGAATGGGAGVSGPCRNCGEEGHYARECDKPKKLTGECFRCGQEGHNKADCTNEPVDRPFTGTCRVCNQEGHPAAQCPEQICRLCLKPGHKAIDCKEKRTVDFGVTTEMTPDAAWEELKKADGKKDLDEFRKAFMAYAKATIAEGGPFDLPEVEKTFREQNMNAHLVAKQKEIPLNYTIVDFEGNADKTYVFGIQWAAKSRRKFFADAFAESPEDNLERLGDCGLVMDRGIPLCNNCQKLGHIRKHCPEELQTSKEALACANCGGEHRLRDCKEERVEKRGLDCRNCGESGHKAADCPKGDQRGPKACRNCGGEDHIAKDCTQPRNPATVKCRNCDEMGHFSKECPKPRDWSRVQCSQCQQFGHTVVRCKAAPVEASGDLGFDNDNGDATAGAASGGWNDAGNEEQGVTSGGGWNNAGGDW